MLDYAGSFIDGMAAVSVGGKRGFVNASGEMTVHVKYDDVTDFSEGLPPCKYWGRLQQ